MEEKIKTQALKNILRQICWLPEFKTVGLSFKSYSPGQMSYPL